MPRASAAAALIAVAVAVAAAGCSGGDGGDLDAFCATARGYVADNPLLALGADPLDDPAGTAAALAAAAERLSAWADDAPGDVDDDVRTLADTAAALAGAFATTPEDLSAEERAELDEQAAAAAEASPRVTSYVAEECGVDLQGPAAGAGATAPTTASP